MNQSSKLLSLPLELAEQVIVACSPNDVASASKSCHHLHKIIYSPSDSHIWRELFLSIFDDPRIRMASDALGHLASPEKIKHASQEIQYDWMGQLQARIAAMNLISDRQKALVVTTQKKTEALQALTSVIETSLPFNLNPGHEDIGDTTTTTSKSLSWLSNLLESVDALNHTVWPSLEGALLATLDQYPQPSELAARSKLHVYMGLTPFDLRGNLAEVPSTSKFTNNSGFPFSGTRLRSAYRSTVYDIRKYTSATLWGPFQIVSGTSPSGKRRVNWRQVEALMMVVAWNAEGKSQTDSMWRDEGHMPPSGFETSRPYGAPGFDQIGQSGSFNEQTELSPSSIGGALHKSLKPPRHPGDWAGVAGQWKRIVCFMDYRDFFRFNYDNPSSNGDLDTSIFEEDDFEEETRVLAIHLRIKEIEQQDSHALPPPELPATLPQNQFGFRPRIHFEGVSHGGTPNESSLQGFVESDPESGEVRWRMISSYGGEERWASEGVQVGGAGSKVGVIGCWSGIHHEDFDPVGPFWFWKVGEP